MVEEEGDGDFNGEGEWKFILNGNQRKRRLLELFMKEEENVEFL